MSDKDIYSFSVMQSGCKTHSYSFNLNYDSSPVEVYKEFLVFLNVIYGWDTEKYIAQLYAKEG